MEDDLNMFENGRRHKFGNGRQPQFFKNGRQHTFFKNGRQPNFFFEMDDCHKKTI